MPYNILIVDDEPAITNGLAYDIDWAAIGVLEVFKANSVAAALEYLYHNKIDVVITDIRMPEMDGMDLAACIKRQWKYAKTIFISGYDEFEYAQKAIDLGVFSYITKPISNGRLVETVTRALREMEAELDNTRLALDVRQARDELLPAIRERALGAWIAKGRPYPGRESLAQIGVGLGDRAFLTLVSGDEGRRAAQTSDDGFGYEIALPAMIDNILFTSSGQQFHFMDHEDNLVIVASTMQNNDLDTTMRYMKGMAEPFQASVYRAAGSTVSIFFGNIVTLEALHDEYTRLVLQARVQRAWKPGLIMEPDQSVRGLEQKGLLLLHASPTFSMLLEARRHREALDRISALFAQARGLQHEAFNAGLQIYFAIVGALFSDSSKAGISIDHWCGEYKHHLVDSQRVTDHHALEKVCQEMADAYLRYLSVMEIRRTSRLVEQVKGYVEQNIQKEITVADIAAHLHLHPNYLLRLFKEETGEVVIDYLISMRIAMAKVLLANEELKIYEVAERVGYDSVSHFSRIFKRETGLSPKDFQQRAALH